MDPEFAGSLEEIERIDGAIQYIGLRKRLLEQELAELASQREALLIVRGLAASSLAPIHRVPDEVLGHIFGFGVEGPSDDFECNSFSNQVLLVSRRWYNVAMTTPSLWSRIYLAPVSISNLKLRLQRSRYVGLNIFVDWTVDDSPKIIEQAISLLFSHVSRWYSLSLRFVGLTPFRDFLDLLARCRGTAQNLHSLSIIMAPRGNGISRPYTQVPLALITPNLGHVELIRAEVDWKSLSMVQTAALYSLSAGTQWQFMQNVRELRLTSFDDPFQATSGRPTLPLLERLTVFKEALGSILWINMPSLRSLTVKSGQRVSPFTWEYSLPQYSLLESLEVLVLGSDSPIPSPFAIHVLRLMPNLRSLQFERSCPQDEFFYLLASSSLTADPICPRLRNFSIINPRRDPSAAVDIFIKSRSGPEGSLPVPIRGWNLQLSLRTLSTPEDDSDSDSYSE